MTDAYVDTTKSTKDEHTGKWTHVFSQTMLGNFQKCPEQARAVYMKEVKSGATDSTALGTACHAGWEYALYEKRDGRTPIVDDMVDVVHHELDVIGEWRYTKMSKATVYDMVPTFMSSWARDILPLVDPVEMEKKFSVLLYSGKHRDIYMNGTIDCIPESYDPWDWKTASRAYERWEKQRWAAQPTVYCYAVEQMYNQYATIGEMTGNQTFTYGIALYDGSTQVLEVTRNQTHLNWLKQMCSQIAWLIENDVNPWSMNDAGWHCSPIWCPVFAAGRCKGSHGIDEPWATKGMAAA